MDTEELRGLIEGTLIRAMKETQCLCIDGTNNGIRSRKFVRYLACDLRKHYSHEEGSIRVSSAGNPKEFLHDISVTKVVDGIAGPRGGGNNERIEKVLWQIESEMSDKSKEFMVDLNKLQAGSEEANKLYIVARNWCERHLEWVSEQVSRTSIGQRGRFFLAFIPHPRIWKCDKLDPTVKICEYTHH